MKPQPAKQKRKKKTGTASHVPGLHFRRELRKEAVDGPLNSEGMQVIKGQKPSQQAILKGAQASFTEPAPRPRANRGDAATPSMNNASGRVVRRVELTWHV